jgi:hypothetical protein
VEKVMKQQASVEIDRPIDEVFEYTNNNVAEWSITVVEDEVIDETPERVGTSFRCVTEERGNRMEFQGVVTRYERPTASAIRLTGKHFDIEAEYVFEDLGGRTRVTQQSAVTPKGLFAVFFFLFGWMMHRSACEAQENELNSLKRLLEEGAGQVSSEPPAEE